MEEIVEALLSQQLRNTVLFQALILPQLDMNAIVCKSSLHQLTASLFGEGNMKARSSIIALNSMDGRT